MDKNLLEVKSFIQRWDYHTEYHYLFYDKKELASSYYIIDNGNSYTLSGVYVFEKFRGKGYAKNMLYHAIDKYKEIDLQVHVENNIAISLYMKFGFKYSDDIDNKEIRKRYRWMSNYEDK